MAEHKYNILHPNESRNFDIEILAVLVADNNEEIFIVKNYEHNQLEPMGIREKDNQLSFYGIKVEKQSLYTKIIKAKVGTKFKLKTDIKTGFWTPREFTKHELTDKIFAKLDYFQSENHFRSCMKTPAGFMF